MQKVIRIQGVIVRLPGGEDERSNRPGEGKERFLCQDD